MAILAKIRQRTLILILIIGLALFAFVISDVITKGDGGQKLPEEIATVDGKSIPLRSFQNQVEYGVNASRGSQSTMQVVNSVWDREIRSALIEQQLEELGITIEKDQIWDMLISSPGITNDPQFKDEAGVFVEGKLQEYVNNLEASQKDSPQKAAEYQNWLAREAFVIKQAKEQLYYNLIKSGSIATVKEGELAYRLENDKVNFKFVQIPYTTIPDADVEITKKDIQNYINSHRSSFEEVESRDIQYVYFEEKPSKADEDGVKDEITKLVKDFETAEDAQIFVNENSDVDSNTIFISKASIPADIKDGVATLEVGQVYGPYKTGDQFKITKLVETKQVPDSVKSRHILIPFLGAISAPQDALAEVEAKKKADSLATVLKGNKSKFADFAKEFSSDPGSKDKGGEYDWSAYNRMTREYNDFTFEKNVGDIDVIKTVFGFHIIEIQGQKGTQDVVKLATVTRNVESSEKTLSDLFTTSTKFEAEAAKGNKSFDDIAKESSYEVKPVNRMKAMDSRILGLGDQRQIIRWTFQDDANVGDIKRFPIEGGFVVAQLTAKHAKGLATVEDASARVLPILKDQKKAEMIIAKNSASTLSELATANNTTVQNATALSMKAPTIPGAGEEKKVVGTAFALKEGQTSKLIAGKKGVFMIEVIKITPAVGKESYLTEMNTLKSQRAASATNTVFNALKKSADIEDNRGAFY